MLRELLPCMNKVINSTLTYRLAPYINYNEARLINLESLFFYFFFVFFFSFLIGMLWMKRPSLSMNLTDSPGPLVRFFPSVYPSSCLPVCHFLFVCLSVTFCLSVCNFLSVCLSVCNFLSVCLSVTFCLSVCLSV